MAGNYDVTNVTVKSGIDNSSSFKTGKNGKKVFIGTDWNETSHITNDANKGTIFAEGQGMTLKLNSRYKNGGADVYSNLDGRHTGISFDLLDKFIEAAADGILEDIDHQGYTQANKEAFGKAFDELRAQKLAEAKKDPYKNEYTKMMKGTEFTFTPEELEKLYKAAGFDLAKKETKPETKVETKPETKPEAKVPVTPPEQPSTPPKKPVSGEGDEKISKSGKELADEIAKALGLPDGEVEIIFKGESVCFEDGKIIYAEGKYTINGETRKFKIDRTGDREVIQTKKVGMFKKWHDVNTTVNDNATENTAKRAEQATQNVTSVAVKNAEQERLDNYYKSHVTDARVWSGKMNIDTDIENPDQFHGQYEQVTSKDGRKLARVSHTENGKKEYKYYEVKAAVVHTELGDRKYTAIIPDLTKEVTDAEF